MKTDLAHIPQQKQAELKKITQIICENCAGVLMLILFGSYARGDYKLVRGKERGKKSDFDLLVITKDFAKKEQVKAYLNAQSFGAISNSVQVLVESLRTINSNLQENQFFFSDIIKEGIVLYDRGNCKFAKAEVLSPAKRQKLAEEDFQEWFNEAKEFWENYKFNLKKKFYRKASFMLQQTVEMCYTTIEMVFSHYNPYEHDLKVLKERVVKFEPQIAEILPTKTPQQQELFDYLNFAYIGGRYRSAEDFPITPAQLAYWSSECAKLLVLTEQVCQARIAKLRQG